MTYRLGLSAVFGLILVMSLFLKLPGYMDRATAPDNLPLINIAAFLERRGFHVSEDRSDSEPIWLSGAVGACRVLIARVSPEGWHRSLVTRVAAGSQLFYTFGGEVYPGHPIMWTRAYHYWGKLNGYLGLNVSVPPVLAVVASPACETTPLRELARLSE